MKKIITTLVAGAMMFGFTAPTFAAINPANIDESSSRDNIYKIVWEDVSEGTNAGVVSIFAWAHIDGKIYSVALSQLRKYGDPSKAFAEIVGAELAVDQLATIKSNAAQQISDTQTRITEVITTINVVDHDSFADAQATIADLQSEIDMLELVAAADALQDVADIQNAFNEGRLEGIQAGIDMVVAEDGITQADVDAARLERGEGSAYQLGFDAGNAEVTRLEGLIGDFNRDGEMLTHEQFLRTIVEVYNGVAGEYPQFTPIDVDNTNFRELTGNLALVVSALHHALEDIDDQLDAIKVQIDRAGEVDLPNGEVNEFGFSSSIDWDGLTTLEKATRIATKLPDLVTKLSTLSTELTTANSVIADVEAHLSSAGYRTGTTLERLQAYGRAITDRYNTAQTTLNTTLGDIADAIGGQVQADWDNDVIGITQLVQAVRDVVAERDTAKSALDDIAADIGISTADLIANAETAARDYYDMGYDAGRDSVTPMTTVRDYLFTNRLGGSSNYGEKARGASYMTGFYSEIASSGAATIFNIASPTGVVVGTVSLDAMIDINGELATAIENAIDAAYTEGFQDGYRAGYQDGYDAGFTDGRVTN